MPSLPCHQVNEDLGSTAIGIDLQWALKLISGVRNLSNGAGAVSYALAAFWAQFPCGRLIMLDSWLFALNDLISGNNSRRLQVLLE